MNPPATTVAYFGPAATFTQEALLTQPDLATADLRPLGSITAVLEAVAHGEADLGFVPIENAIEGTVSATIDGLIHDVDLHIQREVVMDIHLHLMAPPGTGLSDIRSVSSYPHALAQCQKYLAEALPAAEQRAANSTADAARVLGRLAWAVNRLGHAEAQVAVVVHPGEPQVRIGQATQLPHGVVGRALARSNLFDERTKRRSVHDLLYPAQL